MEEIKSSLVNHKSFSGVKDSLLQAAKKDGKVKFRVKMLEYINDTADNDDDAFFFDMLEGVRFLDPDCDAVAYTTPDKHIYLNAPDGGGVGENVRQWDFIYDHECLHQLWDTFAVGDKIKKNHGEKKFSHELLNYASDCVINDYLSYCRKKSMPDDLITPKYIKDQFGVDYDRKKDTQYTLYMKMWEKYEEIKKDPLFQEMMKEMQRQQNQEGQQGQQGQQGQSGQEGSQSGQEGGQSSQSKNSNESAKDAASRAQKAADKAQEAADKAKKEGSKDASKAQEAADKAKEAAKEAKDAADKAESAGKSGDKEEEEKQTKKAQEAANKAEQEANNASGNDSSNNSGNDKKEKGEGSSESDKNRDNRSHHKESDKASDNEKGNPNGNGEGTSNQENKITDAKLDDEWRKKADDLIEKYKNKISGDLGSFLKQCQSSAALNDKGLVVNTQKGVSAWNKKMNQYINAYVKNKVFKKQREFKRTYQRHRRGAGLVKFGDPIQPGKKIKDDKLLINVAFYVDRSGSMTGTIEHVFDAAYIIAESLKRQFSKEKVVSDVEFKMITFDDRIEEITWGKKVQARGGNLSMHEYLKDLNKRTGDYLINVFITDGQFTIEPKEVTELLKELGGCLIYITNQGDDVMEKLAKENPTKLFYILADSQFKIDK